MEKCRFRPQILDLIRMDHIFVIFIKFWVIQSYLKKNPASWESCKNGKMEKCRFRPQISDLIRMNRISVIFIKFWVMQSCLRQNPTIWESCKNGKNGKCRFHSQILDFSQNESHSRGFHQILDKTFVFKAKSNKLGKLQKWEKWKMSISSSNIGFWSK